MYSVTAGATGSRFCSGIATGWLLIKRLEADRFKWPKEYDLIELTVEQLHWLLEGINLSAMQPHPTRNYMHVG